MKTKGGFTIVELMVVLAVIAVVTAIVCVAVLEHEESTHRQL